MLNVILISNIENITFEKFEILYNNNNELNEINMNIKKYQRYYFRYLFKNIIP